MNSYSEPLPEPPSSFGYTAKRLGSTSIPNLHGRLDTDVPIWQLGQTKRVSCGPPQLHRLQALLGSGLGSGSVALHTASRLRSRPCFPSFLRPCGLDHCTKSVPNGHYPPCDGLAATGGDGGTLQGAKDHLTTSALNV